MRKVLIRFIITTTILFTLVATTIYVIAPKELFRFRASEPSERLPQESINFLNENFPKETVLDVDIELTGFEVYLTNGVIVEFRFSGSARSIDNMGWYRYENQASSNESEMLSNTSSLPDSIQNHIETYYSHLVIRKIELDDGIYEIEFTNRLELYFTQLGQLLYVDYD